MTDQIVRAASEGSSPFPLRPTYETVTFDNSYGDNSYGDTTCCMARSGRTRQKYSFLDFSPLVFPL